MKIKILFALLCGTLIISFAACSQKNLQTDDAQMEAINTADMFTDRDREITYSDYVTVKLSDGGTTADGAGVTIEGDIVTIMEEGTYLLTGGLSDGQIVVDTTTESKLQIVLDGVNIQNSDHTAIYIKQAGKVVLTTANASNNTLIVTGDYVQVDDNMVDAVIYSKDDLTMNGAGTLTIQSAYGHGIVSKNDLVLTSGTYEITSAAHGLSSKDSVRIADGNLIIKSGKDAVHAEHAEDPSLGFLYIAGGEFSITAEADGISASSALQIDGGNLTVTTGGGSANAAMASKEARPGFGQPVDQTNDESSISAKGIKANGSLILNGGNFKIDSFDDALHTNKNCYVNGGIFEISSGDDGLHADTAMIVKGGTLDIKKSYEGIEGQKIDLMGGVISIVAVDDGINAGGGADGSGKIENQEMFTAETACSVTISGGRIKVNASGDGVDSNGSFHVTGGETYISGPTNNGNGALDYTGDASVTGGIFVAAGSAGMAQNFGADSTQGSILVALNSSQTGNIRLADENGAVLVEYTPEKQYQSVVMSAPEIEKGKTYHLTAGSESQAIEMNAIIFGESNGMGHGRMSNGRPDGGMPPNGSHPAGTMQEKNP